MAPLHCEALLSTASQDNLLKGLNTIYVSNDQLEPARSTLTSWRHDTHHTCMHICA
jgi:hypothetical protein